jgi:hypothetical protein
MYFSFFSAFLILHSYMMRLNYTGTVVILNTTAQQPHSQAPLQAVDDA